MGCASNPRTAFHKKINGGQQKKKVDKIRHLPHQIKRHDTADKDHDHIDRLIKPLFFSMKQIVKPLPAKIAPSHEGCKSEAENGDCENFITEKGEFAKSCGSERARRQTHPFRRIFQQVGNEDKSGNGTENDGVPKRSTHRNQCLSFRSFLGRVPGDQSGCPQTGFVCEQSSCYAITDCFSDGKARQSAAYGGKTESRRENLLYGRQQNTGMKNEIQTASAKKENCHCRNDCYREFFNPATSLHKNKSYGERYKDCADGRAEGKDLMTGFRDGIGLGCAANKKSRKAQSGTIEQGNGPPVQYMMENIHRAAVILPFKTMAQIGFRVCCRHTKNTSEPAPEDGTRAAQIDGGRDANNITGPQCGRQCGRERAEPPKTFLYGIVILAEGKLDTAADFPLNKV